MDKQVKQELHALFTKYEKLIETEFKDQFLYELFLRELTDILERVL
jgi:hypothetical protein